MAIIQINQLNTVAQTGMGCLTRQVCETQRLVNGSQSTISMGKQRGEQGSYIRKGALLDSTTTASHIL